MKTKLTISTMFFISVLAHTVTAQEASSSTVSRQYQTTMHLFHQIKKIANKKPKSNLVDNQIKGSPYLLDSPKLGNLYIQGSLIETSNFNLNIYNDEIELTENDQVYGILKIDDTKLQIGNEIISLQSYLKDNQEIYKGYFLEVWRGDSISLFIRKKCKLVSSQKAATPNQKDRTAKFVIFENLYVLRPNQTSLTKIKSNKKTLLQLMNNKKTEMSNFIKDSNIDIKETADLKKVFSYYNSLL